MAKSNSVQPIAKKPQQPDKKPVPEKLAWKNVFYCTLIVMTLVAVFSGSGTGFHSDEMDMQAYGDANWKYYKSLGKDTSYKHVTLENGTEVTTLIKTYGGFFELVNSCASKLAGKWVEKYNLRHSLCQLMGLLAIWIAGLISLSLSGRYLVGTCTMLLLFLSPTYFGHLLFNTKDIPFALGYVLCIYGMLLLLKQKNSWHLKPFIFIALGFGICLGTRIGGLVLLAYLAIIAVILIYDWYKKKGITATILRKQLLFLALSLAAGFGLAILSWPFVLSSPFENIRYALDVATRFPQRIPFVFDGEFIDSLTIPTHYILKWMSISIPVFVIMLFIISILALLLNYRKKEARQYAFLLFTVLFPIIYTMLNKPALYSAWRHLLFIYPLLVVFAVYVLHLILRNAQRQYVSYAVCTSCIVCMIHPVYWSVKNHPCEYTYFNEVSGGFAKNYTEYETDYWQLSVKQALKWLYEHEHIKEQKGIIIGSNAFAATQYLMKYTHGDTGSKINQTSFKAKCMVDWNYLVLSNLFIEPYVIENDFYPPINTIYTIEIDGKTICAVVKDTVRNDYHAYVAMQEQRLEEADSLSELYLQKDPDCVKMLEVAAYAKATKKDWPRVYKFCSAGIEYEPNNPALRYYMGVYYANNNMLQAAIIHIEGALTLGFDKKKEGYGILKELYTQAGDAKKAEYYGELAEKAK